MDRGFRLLSKYRKPIMALAAIWIIAFHFWELLTGGTLQKIERVIKGMGFYGVDIFLLMSGYGLYYSMEKSDKLLPFYKKRLSRLWFPVAVVAVCQCVYKKWSVVTLLKNALGYSFLTENIYSFLWFAYFIAILYILFPFYYRLFRRAKHKTVFTLAVFCVWLCASLLLKNKLRYDLWGATNRLPVFALGVLYGYYSKREKDVITPLGWSFIGVMLSAGTVLSFLTCCRGMYLLVPVSNCGIPNFLIAGSLPLVLSLLPELLRGKTYNAVMKCLTFLGDMSFELYCVQELVCGILRDVFDGMHGIVWNVSVYFCVLLSASAVFYLQKLLRKAVSRRV